MAAVMSERRIHEGQIRELLASASGQNRTDLRRFSEQLFKSIQKALAEQGHVRLHRFGSFTLKWTRERRGRNPQSGEPIIIPAHPRVVFTPAKALRERIGIACPEPENTLPVTRTTPPAPVSEVQTSPRSESLAEETRPVRFVKRKFAAIVLVVSLATLAAIGPGFFGENPDTRQVAGQGSIAEPKHSERKQVTENKTPMVLTDTAVPRIADMAASQMAQPVIKTKTPEAKPFFSRRRYRLKNGDSFWRLSGKYYVNPFYWPHIYRTNEKNFADPNRILIGKTIVLPELQGNPEQLSARDKRNIAEGYFRVYLYYKKRHRPFPYYALLGVSKFDPSVLDTHRDLIDEQDRQNLQLAGN